MRKQIARKKLPMTQEATPRSVERELAWASGVEYFQHVDPLSQVTEQFQMTFDRIGQRHSAALAAESGSGFSLDEEREEADSARPDRPSQEESPAAGRRGLNLPGSQVPMEFFSQTAFRRGVLSGAVMEGTGKMMLLSCLKRTVGQSGPMQMRQATLFDVGSQRRNIPGHNPDMVQFNRGVARSAVGVVVDTLRDARRVVQSMEALAQGCGELEADQGGATLRTMYPFLDDTRERTLVEQYQGRLRETADPQEVSILQHALVRARALIQKKAQMKNEFINKLRLISDRATETLEELETPGALEEIVTALLGPDLPEGEEPPDDSDDAAQWGYSPDGGDPDPGAAEPEQDWGLGELGFEPGPAGPGDGDGSGSVFT